MLDIKFIRENKDVVKEAISKKKFKVDLDELLALDDKRLDLLSQVEPLRAEQNKASESISSESDPEKRNKLIEEMKEVKTRLSSLEEELKDVMVSWQKLMLEVPNVPDVSVPDGNTDEDNQEVKQVGEKPTFSFTPKDHIELMESLDLADFERGTKVSGFRGYFLKNEGATLSFAIWQYMMEKMVSKGFIPMIVPSLVNKETLYGTGYLPNG